MPDQHQVIGKNNMMEKSDLHGGNQEHGLTGEKWENNDWGRQLFGRSNTLKGEEMVWTRGSKERRHRGTARINTKSNVFILHYFLSERMKWDKKLEFLWKSPSTHIQIQMAEMNKDEMWLMKKNKSKHVELCVWVWCWTFCQDMHSSNCPGVTAIY